jgi:hypothetical protein
LGQLSLPAELRDSLVHLWWLRRQRPRNANPTAVGGYRQVAVLVQQVRCQGLDPNWRESYRQVARVLGRAVRASPAVECMNSVLWMHQSRHRTLTQEMLDLKRLYWNTRVFRGGKRKGRSPYEHLGLTRPDSTFWGLLSAEMSLAGTKVEAKAQGIAACRLSVSERSDRAGWPRISDPREHPKVSVRRPSTRDGLPWRHGILSAGLSTKRQPGNQRFGTIPGINLLTIVHVVMDALSPLPNFNGIRQRLGQAVRPPKEPTPDSLARSACDDLNQPAG